MKHNPMTALLIAGAVLCSSAWTARAAGSETKIVLSDDKITVDGRTASTGETDRKSVV